MGLMFEDYANREEWLVGRNQGIGASEAGAVCGMSPFETARDVYYRKTGIEPAKDLSKNSAVEYGNRLEPAMRTMFQAEHPELTLTYHPFGVYFQEERPWIRATLDGELTDAEGRRYVLEIKTAAVSNASRWAKWKDRIPEYYMAQCIAQMAATGWDGVYLFAKLTKLNGDSELRTYKIERSEHEEDIKWLVGKLNEFWHMVLNRIPPPYVLPGIS